MRKFPIILLLVLVATQVMTSCFKDDKDDGGKYSDWKKANEAWVQEQINRVDGKANYYTTVQAPWDPNSVVYIHWFNDTMLTRGNLRPFYTSTVDVKYKAMLYDGTAVDSSYLRTSPAQGVFRTKLSGSVIEAWSLAVTRMHVGDSCLIIAPYNVAYGSTGSGSTVKPYSAMQFAIKLVDIYKLEK